MPHLFTLEHVMLKRRLPPRLHTQLRDGGVQCLLQTTLRHHALNTMLLRANDTSSYHIARMQSSVLDICQRLPFEYLRFCEYKFRLKNKVLRYVK